MPEATLVISVSRREADRPRLLQVTAVSAAGIAAEGVAVVAKVDENGTFADDEAAPDRKRELMTGPHGIAFLQWFEWPRNGPARDFHSVVTVSWDGPELRVLVEDLYE